MRTKLRQLVAADHDVVFEMMADPVAVRMAAFTAEDPGDRAAFDAHLARTSKIVGARHWAVVNDNDELVGTISTFPSEVGCPEVTYWIVREHWGQGHATEALRLVLAQTERPVRARAAADNVASRRVLEKVGFIVVGQDTGFANARKAQIEEVILRLE
ncbi:GNAT family N-acetyltransferase [Psychromicrobium lacuslunae]|uniref:Acetyltransferase n=1 Tax=Psychromicrobium lacuslunae TaxID=1618207 RepID=A0A0D4BXW3_9MICC|nr:GNAT family N-acetyltransferase [Psychromicrobium lacuslunae]AJT41139.1 acetyltransferase [Psychromicrobium lacuslunae]